MKMSKNGFTSIDLFVFLFFFLLVIAIDIITVSYFGKKTEDIQVLAEIKRIRSALEIYVQLNNNYPEKNEPTELTNSNLGTEKLCQEGFRRMTDNCEKVLMAPIPNYLKADGNVYLYQSVDNGKNYRIEFSLKSDFKELGLLKGKNCADNSQILSQSCF